MKTLSSMIVVAVEMLGAEDATTGLAMLANAHGTAAIRSLAADLLADRLIECEVVTQQAADEGETPREWVCGRFFGHQFPSGIEESERCLCARCGKDGDA